MRSVDAVEPERELRSLADETTEPAIRDSLGVLGDAISVGNINNTTGVAIGRNIRQVISHFELSPETAAALLDLRTMHGTALGLDAAQYRWGSLLIDRTTNFIGRDYVFDAVDRFIASHASGYFVIQAPPGVGKSALMAEYIRRTGCIAHFNSRALGVTGASQFLQNACAQLIADAGLSYPALPAEATRDGAFLLELLRNATDPLVIAIDALDEVDAGVLADGANVLFLPPTLPDGVHFVMTRRNADVALVTHSPVEVFDLLAHPAENRADVEMYLRHCLKRPALRDWLAERGHAEADFVATLAELSESNFMYLRHVIPELEHGAYRDLTIDRLPAGLVGYYEDHWRRMGMTTKPLPRLELRIIYALCEARQPVSRMLLTRFAGDAELPADELQVQEVLEGWREFLLDDQTSEQTLYSVYHASFREFLHRKDVVQAAGLTIDGINALIADNLWSSIFLS